MFDSYVLLTSLKLLMAITTVCRRLPINFVLFFFSFDRLHKSTPNNFIFTKIYANEQLRHLSPHNKDIVFFCTQFGHTDDRNKAIMLCGSTLSKLAWINDNNQL